MQGSNPHAIPSVSVSALIASLVKNHNLLLQMARREVVGRYRGSVLGLAWSFFYPVLMLVVYTFVFSEIFGMRWSGVQVAGDKVQFALMVFVGMIVFGLFSEVMNRAPTLILSNVNYVKKVVFPLEILPVITLTVAIFHVVASVLVFMAFYAATYAQLQWTIILFPLVLLPIAILTLGLSWMLASLGVFVRDIGQTIGIVMSVLMFLSPVFYPLSAVPQRFQPFILANPLTFIIEQSRDVLILGRVPDWLGLAIYLLISLFVAWIGYAWFQKTRKGFADVL